MDKPVFEFAYSTEWKHYPDGDHDEDFYLENLTDYDPNEDHICGYCGKKLPGRFLFCSAECDEALFNKCRMTSSST